MNYIGCTMHSQSTYVQTFNISNQVFLNIYRKVLLYGNLLLNASLIVIMADFHATKYLRSVDT